MMESTDTRGLGRVLCMALLAIAGSGCATMSERGAPDYAHSMAAAESAVQGDDASVAIQAYHRAAQASPDQSLPWLEIAQLEAEAGDWPQAVAASREVLRRDPDDSVARDIYVRGSLQLAVDALQYLPVNPADIDSPAHEMAAELLERLVGTLGDEAIPADARARLKAEVETRLRLPGARATRSRSNLKTPDKLATDPFDVLGDG